MGACIFDKVTVIGIIGKAARESAARGELKFRVTYSGDESRNTYTIPKKLLEEFVTFVAEVTTWVKENDPDAKIL